MDVWIVYKQKCMFAFFMFVVVINPFLFHQAADKIKVSLAVLHAIIPFPVSGPGVVFKRPIIEVFEHFLNNFRDGFVLKNPAIGGARQKPQPRMNGRKVPGITALIDGLRNAADIAVKVTLFVASQIEPDRDILA